MQLGFSRLQTTKQRYIWVDVAKALAMLLVVLGHIMSYYGEYNSFKQTFIMFHVPCFFFISGMFYSGNKGVKLYIQKRVKVLIIPYFFFSITLSFVLSCFIFIPISYIFNRICPLCVGKF